MIKQLDAYLSQLPVEDFLQPVNFTAVLHLPPSLPGIFLFFSSTSLYVLYLSNNIFSH